MILLNIEPDRARNNPDSAMVPREGNQVKRVTTFDLALIEPKRAGNNPESLIIPKQVKQVKRVTTFDLALDRSRESPGTILIL